MSVGRNSAQGVAWAARRLWAYRCRPSSCRAMRRGVNWAEIPQCALGVARKWCFYFGRGPAKTATRWPRGCIAPAGARWCARLSAIRGWIEGQGRARDTDGRTAQPEAARQGRDSIRPCCGGRRESCGQAIGAGRLPDRLRSTSLEPEGWGTGVWGGQAIAIWKLSCMPRAGRARKPSVTRCNRRGPAVILGACC